MKNQLTLVLSAAAGLILAACGGGGSSGTAPPAAVNNTAPTVSTDTSNPTVLQDSVSDPVAFTVGDKETSASDLKISLQSSDTDLITADDIDVGGSGSARTLVLRPKAGAAGAATVTVTVADAAGLTASQAFNLQVSTQQASYTGFVSSTLAMPDSATPAETMGKTWTDLSTDDPTAFDSLFP